MKNSPGHAIYFNSRCQWTADNNGTEDGKGKRESTPIFATMSCDVTRPDKWFGNPNNKLYSSDYIIRSRLYYFGFEANIFWS